MTDLTEQAKKNIQEFGTLVGSIMAYNWYLEPERRAIEDRRVIELGTELKDNPVGNFNERSFQAGASNEYFWEAVGIGRTLGVSLDEWPFPDYEVRQDLEVDRAHWQYFPSLCDMDVNPRTTIIQAYGLHAGRLEQHFERKRKLIWERERLNKNTGSYDFQMAILEGRKDYTIARTRLLEIVEPMKWSVDLDKWFEVLGYFHHGPQLETVNETVLKELFSR